MSSSFVLRRLPITLQRSFSSCSSSFSSVASASASAGSSSASAAFTPKNIGFVGLGNMGAHMATNLYKAGHNLYVFDVFSAAIDRWLASASALNLSGKYCASSPKEFVSNCDVIVSMLPSSPHVADFYVNSPNAIFSTFKSLSPSSRRVSLCIDSSTIDPTASRSVSSAASLLPLEMVDAPVSGGVGGAQAGTLTFMVGGSDSGYNSALPFLEKMGKNIVHCGGHGNGQVAKVANNLVLGISMVAVSEGMNLGVQLGMDPKKLASIFNTSSARCWSSDTYNPCPGVLPNVPSSKQYAGGFGTALMRKDLGLAMDAAKSQGIPLELGQAAAKVYQQVMDEGNSGKDFSYVYQLMIQNTKK